MRESRSDEQGIKFGAPLTVAEIDLRPGAPREILDPAEPGSELAGLARFIVAAHDHVEALVQGLTLDSTTKLSIPPWTSTATRPTTSGSASTSTTNS